MTESPCNNCKHLKTTSDSFGNSGQETYCNLRSRIYHEAGYGSHLGGAECIYDPILKVRYEAVGDESERIEEIKSLQDQLSIARSANRTLKEMNEDLKRGLRALSP